ncbi:MAG TPA: hypothetical protein GXZ98_09035 [Firmicutes bacterium]|jgi:ribosomal protein L7Ae-like RNA K-turn-binding protein|nr:hypothetical protein [Bacillota bacterium]
MNNFLNLLGIARKAGELALGFTATADGLRKGKVTLVLLATDTSPHTKEKIERLCRRHQVRFDYVANQEALGRALGKSSQAVIGVFSPHMGKALESRLPARTE